MKAATWAEIEPLFKRHLKRFANLYCQWANSKATDTVMRALSTGGLSLITKEGNVMYEPNCCKCCGHTAQQYGTGWGGTGGSGSCSREVCVLCLEGGCGCFGSELERPAAEVHDNCQHDKEKVALDA